MNSIIGILSLFGLIWLGFLFRQAMVDHFRLKLFKLLNDLSQLEKDSEEYLRLETAIYGYIENAEIVSYTLLKRFAKLSEKEEIQEKIGDIKFSGDFEKIHQALIFHVMYFVLWRTPFSYILGPILILYSILNLFYRLIRELYSSYSDIITLERTSAPPFRNVEPRVIDDFGIELGQLRSS